VDLGGLADGSSQQTLRRGLSRVRERELVEQFNVSCTPSGQLTMAVMGARHGDTVISVALAYFGSQQEQGLGGPSKIIGWR
jgi:hypothetical protein